MLKKLIAMALLTLGASNAMAAIGTNSAEFTATGEIPVTCVITSETGSAKIEFGPDPSTQFVAFTIISNSTSPDPASYAVTDPSTNFRLVSGGAIGYDDPITGFAFVNGTGHVPVGVPMVLPLNNGVGVVNIGVDTDLATTAFKATSSGEVRGTITFTCPNVI